MSRRNTQTSLVGLTLLLTLWAFGCARTRASDERAPLTVATRSRAVMQQTADSANRRRVRAL